MSENENEIKDWCDLQKCPHCGVSPKCPDCGNYMHPDKREHWECPKCGYSTEGAKLKGGQN